MNPNAELQAVKKSVFLLMKTVFQKLQEKGEKFAFDFNLYACLISKIWMFCKHNPYQDIIL